MILNKPLNHLIELYNDNLSKVVNNTPSSQIFLFETTAKIIAVPEKIYTNDKVYYKVGANDKTISVAIDKKYSEFKVDDDVKIIGQFYLRSINSNKGSQVLLINIAAEKMELIEPRLNQENPLSDIENLKSFPQQRVSFPFGKALNVALIQPNSNTTVEDFKKKMPSNGIYIQDYPINIGSKTAILECFKKVLTDNQTRPYKFNILAVIRGGGEGFEIFDDLDICREFANINMHKIVGLGHEKDRCLIEFFADHAEATPSYIASYLLNQIELSSKNRTIPKINDKKNKMETKLNWIIGLLFVGFFIVMPVIMKMIK